MAQWLDYRVRVTISDARMLVGPLEQLMNGSVGEPNFHVKIWWKIQGGSSCVKRKTYLAILLVTFLGMVKTWPF